MAKAKTKVIGYGRASTDKQQLSPEVQKELVMNWFNQNKTNEKRFPNGAYFHEFLVEQISASVGLLCRPVGQHLITSLGAGDVVVFAKFTRAFRSAADAEQSLDAFKAAGIQAVFLDLQIDTATPNGQFIAGIMGAAGRLERDLSAERTKEALQAMKRQGKPVNAMAPIGWKCKGLGTGNARFVVDEDQRMQAQTAFELVRADNTSAAVYAYFLAAYEKDNRLTRYGKHQLLRMATGYALRFPKIGQAEAELAAGMCMDSQEFVKRRSTYHRLIRGKIADMFPNAYGTEKDLE